VLERDIDRLGRERIARLNRRVDRPQHDGIQRRLREVDTPLARVSRARSFSTSTSDRSTSRFVATPAARRWRTHVRS
jgi:hypothetical protein